MKSQMRRKASLLSRVSTIAVMAAAGAFGAAQQAQADCGGAAGTFDVPAEGQTISANTTCVTVSADVTGDVTNQALVGDPGSGFIPFEVYADIAGKLINNGNIFGGYGSDGALTIHQGATITNGIENNGAITSTSGNGLQIGGGGEGIDEGHILTGITNTNNISSGGGYGVAALDGTLAGGLTNQFDNQASTIGGGLAGIYIGDTFTSWSGGIHNFGQISGVDAAILMGDGGDGGTTTFDGGIINNGSGVIDSANGTAILITNDIATFTGGIVNSGQIQGAEDAIGIEAGSFSGGVINNLFASLVAQSGDAVRVVTDNWSGNFDNQGFISATGDGFDYFGGEGSTFAGNALNSGTIDADGGGIRILVNAFEGNVSNSGLIDVGGEGFGTGILISASTIAGPGGEGRSQITNTGTIQAGFGGVHVFGDTVDADFINTTSDEVNNVPPGVIIAQSGAAVTLTADTSWEGDITNDGLISGGNAGMIINGFSDGFIISSNGTYEGAITNTGVIEGDFVGVYIGGASVAGDLNNSGLIEGGASTEGAGISVFATTWTGNLTNTATGSIDGGVLIEGQTFTGNILNAGQISHSYLGPQPIPETEGDAVRITSTVVGDFTNTGTIEGGEAGVWIDPLEGPFSEGTFTGNFLNSGFISGEQFVGVTIEVDSFEGNITNTGTGTISGGNVGFNFEAGAFEGDFTNSGLISGGETGAYISAGTFTGDIINDGTIIGGGTDTGLHVDVGTYNGDIENNGTLSALSNALHVEISSALNGSIINTGLIGATNLGATAVLLDVNGGTTFTNTGGGLVLGDIVFGGKAAYDFVGEDGGVEGSLIGQGGEGGNDDVITVQNGTQYFIDGGGENGTASNFASFNVDAGGFAVMGATGEGASGGTGYSFSNVDTLNVNNGGTLYIDKSTTLNVDNNYVQQAGGTLEFYLGAPSGISTASGTIIADPGDYGQILVGGTATLDGTIAGYLDPAFGSANPGLDIVEYNDVIVATGTITTDFSTLALINSNSIWELDSIIDGNTVDLRVQRTADLGHIGGLPGIVVETAGPWKSMVNDRSNGIGSGSCGLAGDGWCFNRFADAGAGQVMTDATPGEDPFGWLRTGVRRVGETAVWGRAVGVWGETDGDAGSSGTEFDVVGGIVGVDHVFTPVLLAGLAAQWTTSDVDFNGLPDNAEIDSFEVGAYASYGDTRLYLNANASVIWHDIEVNRFAIGGPAFGDYDGTTVSAYLEAGKIFETQSGFRIQPLVALSYAHLETDAYSETGGPGVSLLNVFESDFDTLKSNVGARFAYPIALQSGRKLVPEARLVWAHEFLDDQSSFLATIQGGSPTPNLIVGEEYSRDTIIIGTGITAPLSDATTLFVDYDAGLNDDITTHTVSAGFRTRW